MCKQMGLNTAFAEATNAVETAQLDAELTKNLCKHVTPTGTKAKVEVSPMLLHLP